MAKGTKKQKEERLEDVLWACREHLRGKADMSDKRDVLLTLVFLKFMSDRFVEQQDYTTALGEVGAKATELLKCQADNAQRLSAAFKALGVKV